jgi:hypothetical protein
VFFCFGIHFNAILGNLPSATLWIWPFHEFRPYSLKKILYIIILFQSLLIGFIPTEFRTKFSHKFFCLLFPRDHHVIASLSASNITWYVHNTKLPLQEVSEVPATFIFCKCSLREFSSDT